jgi:hypothetical protein
MPRKKKAARMDSLTNRHYFARMQIDHDPNETRRPRSGGQWGDYAASVIGMALILWLTRSYVLDPYFCSWLGLCS